jgi:hypothetical protein
MSDIDDRIRTALTAAATQIDERDLRPAAAPTRRRFHQARWAPPLLAAAVVAAVAITAGVLIASRDAAGPSRVRPGASPNSTSTAPITTVATGAAPVSTGRMPVKNGLTCSFADISCPTPSNSLYYQPLWPFASYAEAHQWETVDGPAGRDPWHADPASTALAFATGYLKFADITTVTSRTVTGEQAHIGVGYALPTGGMHTAAVLHLVRYAAKVGDAAAGWEVVGSDDTTFTLDRPTYLSPVPPTLTVDGRVTGVDENIVVAVRNQAGTVVSGAVPRVPAGGTNSPWAVRVPVSGSGVLTVVAYIGGHLSQHEQFAIQGVHT